MPTDAPTSSLRLAPVSLAMAASLAAPGCAPDAGPLFEEVAAAAGLDVVLTCGVPGAKRTILEVNGNGLALVDLDGDGALDVVLVDGSTRERWLRDEPVTHHVLRNEGVRDGQLSFAPVADTGLTMSGWPTGVVSGDVDGDGRPDLVVGGMGEDALFLNRTEVGGPIRFEKRSLPGRTSPLDWTTSVALADDDGDGRLDLYLVRYLTIDPADPPLGAIDGVPCRFGELDVMCGPHGLPPQPDVLLRAVDGAGGFEDATEVAGLAGAAAYGLGVLWQDLDLDGDVDLYVANDSVDNFVLANRGDGTYERRGPLSGAATDRSGHPQAGMGVDAGDLDRDGDLDIVVTNFSDETNALYRHDGGLLYRDVTAVSGLGAVSTPLLGWGVLLADFDADGWLDLFWANGHVFPQADEPGTGTAYAQPAMLMPGTGDGALGPNVFPDRRPHLGRAAATGDLDGDGDLDLVVLTLDGPPLLYVNRTDRPERQLLVQLRGAPPAAPDAFGATLTLRTGDGVHLRQKVSASSFQASGDDRLHFGGLGTVTGAEVLWPGGERESLAMDALRPGRLVTIEQGRGVVDSAPLGESPP